MSKQMMKDRSVSVVGLGAMGAQGVRKALEILHKELDVAMALSGTVRLDRRSGNFGHDLMVIFKTNEPILR